MSVRTCDAARRYLQAFYNSSAALRSRTACCSDADSCLRQDLLGHIDVTKKLIQTHVLKVGGTACAVRCMRCLVQCASPP